MRIAIAVVCFVMTFGSSFGSAASSLEWKLLEDEADRLLSVGELNEAVQYYWRAFGSVERGTEQSIFSAMGLYNIYSMVENNGEAMRWAQVAKEDAAIVYGINHPSYALTLTNLANAQKSLGLTTEATKAYRESMRIIEGYFGERSSYLLTPLNGLATIYMNESEYSVAELYLQRIVVVSRDTKNEDLLAHAYANLGVIRKETGRYGEAENFYEMSKAIFSMVSGPGSLDVASINVEIGQSFFRAGRFQDAVAPLKQALSAYQAMIGGKHVRAIEGALILAKVYVKLNDAKAAISVAEHGIDLSANVPNANAKVIRELHELLKSLKAK